MTVNKPILSRSQTEVRHLKLKLTVFRAIDNPILCEEYAQGHIELLKAYGVTSITSNDRVWDKNPGTYIIIARDMDTQKIVGGIRIQKYSDGYPLPVQTAICDVAPEVNERVEFHHELHGAGEMCGLWNSKSVAKMQVSWMLTRASVVICSQLGVTSLWGICADYTLRMFEDVGYRKITDIGDEGKFPYPNDTYISYVVVMDTAELVTHSQKARAEIKELRSQFNQKRTFKGQGYKIDVDYHLEVKGI